MPARLKIMLAVLLGIGLLMLFDSPSEPEVVGVAERPRRPQTPQSAQATAVLARAPSAPVDPDSPVPDLFAGGPAQPAEQGAAGAAPDDPDPSDKPQAPFVLLGFKVEDGVREAYLLRNDAVLLARAGSVFDKRYRVLALRQESVDIQDQQTGKEHRISFGTEE